MKYSLILASLFAVSTFVSADEAVVPESIVPAAVEVSFEALDADQDGVVTLEEVKDNEALVDAFAELDLDQTGDLTASELSKFVMTTES
jgi:Ca2+-binding EF-hand superfamily protein